MAKGLGIIYAQLGQYERAMSGTCVQSIRWTSGSELYGDAEQRLRFAFQLVRMLSEREDPTVIQSWLTGLNPELGDRVPLRLMRENDLEKVAPEIMGAARAFLICG
jgi:hypothetical protein